MPEYPNKVSSLLDLVSGSKEFIPNMKEKFPYTISFASSELKVFSPTQDDIYLANASVENLKKYFNADIDIDLEKNYDLLGVAFNAFVVNRVNKNDQVVATAEALASVKNFRYKPINIEHDRETIVGLITGHGFSEFGTDKILTEEEVKGSNDPFNVVLHGFIWKVADKDFAKKLEDSADPDSPNYLKISASWELGFREFAAVTGSKNLVECEEFELENLDQAKAILKHFGGAGKDKDGNPIYIQILGELLPLGIGLTSKPASEVKGVAVKSSKDFKGKEESKASEEKEPETKQKDEKNKEIEENSQKSEKNISLSESNNVLANTNKKSLIMLIKNVNDIKEENLAEISASDVSTYIESELKKASEKWSTEKSEIEAGIKTSKGEAEKLKLEVEAAKAEAEKVKAEAEEVKEKLAEIERVAAATAVEQEFQVRMTSLDEDYNLTDEDREVIGSQIKDLDADGFSTWVKSFSVIAKEKKKEAKAEGDDKDKDKDKDKEKPYFGKDKDKDKDKDKEKEDKDKADKEAKASEAESAVSDLKEKKGGELPNNGVETSKGGFKELFAKAFTKDSVKITK